MRRINLISRKRNATGRPKYKARRGLAMRRRRFARRRVSKSARRFKSYSAAKRRVPQPRAMSKRAMFNHDGSLRSNKVLAYDMMAIPKVVTSGTDQSTMVDPRYRDSDTVQIRGFKLQAAFRNTTNSEKVVKVFVVVKKYSGVFTTVDGWINNGVTATPYQDFDSDIMSGQVVLNAKLNPNLWDVIYSKTMKLGPQFESASTSIQSNMPAQANLTQYIKFNKRVCYESTDANRVYVLILNDDVMRGTGGQPSTTDLVNHQIVNTVYFTDL